MIIPIRLVKKYSFMLVKSVFCFWNKSRLFDNVDCCSILLYGLENLFLSAAFIITILHVNFSGFGFGVMFATLIFFVLRYIEHQIIYPVWVPPEARFCVALPSQYGLPYEELELETADGERLAAYLVLQEHDVRARVPTILFCHGNAGNIGSRLLNVAQMHKFCLVNVLIFDYRGYGRSSGRPTEFGLYRDAQAALDYLSSRTDIDSNNIVLFGRSLGGAVAIETAVRNSSNAFPKALIVENTFTSIPATARHLFRVPFIANRLPDWLLRNQFQSIDKIDRVKIPVLFISGEKDDFIPPTMMLELYMRCAPALKSLNRVPSGDHNNTWTRPGYFEAINSFLSGLRPVSGPEIFVRSI